jgi:hypothetical protein
MPAILSYSSYQHMLDKVRFADHRALAEYFNIELTIHLSLAAAIERCRLQVCPKESSYETLMLNSFIP